MDPFELVYGVGAQVSLPLELVTSKLRTMIEDQSFKDSLEKRVMYLTKLEEERDKLVDTFIEHCERVNKFFDKREMPHKFMEDDEIILWDKQNEPKGSHGKLESLWRGPFNIK